MKPFILFGKEIPVWVATSALTGFVVLIGFLINNGLVQNSERQMGLEYIKLVSEDPSLLCSNASYSTEYIQFYPRTVEVTEEMISKESQKVSSQINQLEQALQKAKKGLGENNNTQSIKNNLTELRQKLSRVEDGAVSEFLGRSMPNRPQDIKKAKEWSDYQKFFVSYFQEKFNINGKLFNAPRSSLIGLDQESYNKLTEKIFENPLIALKEINDLNCIETLTLPKVAVINPDRIVEYNTDIHRGAADYIINIEPISTLTNLKHLDAERARLATNLAAEKVSSKTKLNWPSSSAVFRKLTNLKVLNIQAGLDYSCNIVQSGSGSGEDAECPYGAAYCGDSDRQLYLKGAGLGQATVNACNPDNYWNETTRNSRTGITESWDNCGSDIRDVTKLTKLKKLILPSRILHGFSGIAQLNNLDYLSAENMQSPIDFADLSINQTQTNPKSDEEGQKLNIDFIGEALDYLTVGGNITSLPLTPMKELLELYIDIKASNKINLSYLYSMSRLKVLNISGKTDVPPELCRTLKEKLTETDVTCKVITREKETQMAEIEAKKRIYEKEEIPPFPGFSNTKKYTYPGLYPDYPGEPSENNYDYSNQEPIAMGERWYEMTITYSGGGLSPTLGIDENRRFLTLSWELGGVWDTFLARYYEELAYEKSNYNEDLELYREYVPAIARTIEDRREAEESSEKTFLDKLKKFYQYIYGFTQEGRINYDPTITYCQIVKKTVNGKTVDVNKCVRFTHITPFSFNKQINILTPPPIKKTRKILVCDPKSFDRELWRNLWTNRYMDYSVSHPRNEENESQGEYQERVYRTVDNLIAGSAYSLGDSSGEIAPWSATPIGSWMKLVPRWGVSFNPDLTGIDWPPGPEEVLDEKDKRFCFLGPGCEEEELIIEPILLTPPEGHEVEYNETIEFSWKMSDNSQPDKYYWNVLINGKESPELDNWFGLDVGSVTSFIYPSNVFNQSLSPGVWTWRVGAEYLGKGIYWSEDRVLIRNWMLP